jgi:hypothetical protein
MAFLLSVRNGLVDPPGLILTSGEARRELDRRAAERRAAWLAARVWLNRRAAR